MILYNTDSWVDLILKYNGTVWRVIWWKVVIISLYTALGFAFTVHAGFNLGHMKSNILGSTLSFLLVFRANNAYSRYWQGRTVLTDFFSTLREVVAFACQFLLGGKRGRAWRWRDPSSVAGLTRKTPQELDKLMDTPDDICTEYRTDICRWALAVALALQMHTRILDELNHGSMSSTTKYYVDWDRYRIRQLTTNTEFVELDKMIRSLALPQELWDDQPLKDLKGFSTPYEQGLGPPDSTPPEIEINTVPGIRLPVAVLYKLNEVLVRCMNDARVQDKPWAITERFIPIFSKLSLTLMQSFSLINQIVSTPLPFPYFHLCKTLLFTYFISFPFFIQYELGLWANVGELMCLSVALLGVDAIATELEDPFGDDENDLDIYNKVSSLEHEIMFMLRVSGDTKAAKNFVWRDMPQELTESCVVPVKRYLALKSQVDSHGRSEEIFAESRVYDATFESVPLSFYASSQPTPKFRASKSNLLPGVKKEEEEQEEEEDDDSD